MAEYPFGPSQDQVDDGSIPALSQIYRPRKPGQGPGSEGTSVNPSSSGGFTGAPPSRRPDAT